METVIKVAGQFEKVSPAQYREGIRNNFGPDAYSIALMDDQLKTLLIPTRATLDSAGHDFYSPLTFALKPCTTIVIPTGIRALINPGWWLAIFPRSGLGFKYQACLANTVGVIDSDYSEGENEGHIFIKLVNRGDKTINIYAGDRFAQGVFLPYGIASNSEVMSEVRKGGMGSTGK